MGQSLAYGGGEPHRYAEYFANQAFRALIDKGAKAPFVFQAYDDTTVAVLPIVSFDGTSVTLWAFYAPKNALTMDKLLHGDPGELTGLWRKYARGYVVATYNPQAAQYMVVLDHSATRRAAKALSDRRSYTVEAQPRELDKALGTSLADAHSKRWLRTDVYGRPLLTSPAAN